MKRHPSELALGHNQHYHTRRGRVLKLARYRTPRTIQALPLPSVEPDTRMTLVRLANYALSMVLLWAVILAWAVSLVQP